MRLVYTLAVRFYGWAIRIAALRNAKAKAWVEGRKHWEERLRALPLPAGEGSCLWFHVASMGEYEQAVPVMEACRKRFPEKRIVLSFFSPSGYEHLKGKQTTADHVVYLPLDTPANARRFLDCVKPWRVFFIKYEYWFNFMAELTRREIPFYFVASRFRESQYFFKSYGRWFARQLRSASAFFVQDEDSVRLLGQIGVSRAVRCGDTRFDRVSEILSQAVSYPLAEAFFAGRKVFMAGSSWPEDEEVYFPFFRENALDWALVVVPHELGLRRLQALERFLGNVPHVFYSRLEAGKAAGGQARVLVVDKMGMLSRLYRYADVAYVGGGFGKGIHNVLEPAVYSLPVLFGPAFRKFGEAVDLIGCGGAFCVRSGEEFARCMDALRKEDFRKEVSRKAGAYVQSCTGAAGKVMDEVFGVMEQ